MKCLSMHFLKPQKEAVALGATGIAIHLLDAIVVDNVGCEVSINGGDDEFHLCVRD